MMRFILIFVFLVLLESIWLYKYFFLCSRLYEMSAPSPCHVLPLCTESCYGNFFFMDHFLSTWSVALPNPVHAITDSGGHSGKLDLCVFSWLTGENLSLPIPLEKKRIVECGPWQSIPCVLMVGLSWTASSAADIYTQLTQFSERGQAEKGEQVYEERSDLH